MKKALIIGIDDYPDSPLAGCVADAVAMNRVLERNGDGSPNFAVELRTSDRDNTSRAALRSDIEALFVGDSDAALLYFSGHGFSDTTGGSIVTVDAARHDEGISMDWILSLANSSKAKNKVVVLDCCFSGAFGTPTSTGAVTSAIAPGISILTASRDSELAMEVGGRGVFTSLLVDALQGGAADLRGNITPGSLYAYVDEALGAWDQRPTFKTNTSSFVAIRTVSPRVPTRTLRKLTTYFADPASTHDLDPSYEFTEVGAVEGNVGIFKDLQKFASVGLVVPVDEEHMYFAAMHSKSCRLTAVGAQYWRLVDEMKL